MSNKTTATGGYLLPHPEAPSLDTAPAGLTFVQFVQTVLVGLSGFKGNLVRPQWQKEPPKEPDIDTDWLAFGLETAEADNNAYISIDADGNPGLQRNELVPITVSVYGPNAYDNVGLIRDGFQLTQNLAAFRRANIGFAWDTAAIHAPDFFNERWYERWRIQFYVRRQIQRVYPLLTFLSANGTIYTETAENDNYQLPFAASGE